MSSRWTPESSRVASPIPPRHQKTISTRIHLSQPHLKRVSPVAKKNAHPHRYILREVTPRPARGASLPYHLHRDLGKILEFVVRDSASYSDVARIIAYTLPTRWSSPSPWPPRRHSPRPLPPRRRQRNHRHARRRHGRHRLRPHRLHRLRRRPRSRPLQLLYSHPAPPPASSPSANPSNPPRPPSRSNHESSTKSSKTRPLHPGRHPRRRAAVWQHVFLADLTEPPPPNHHRRQPSSSTEPPTPPTPDHPPPSPQRGQHETSATDPNQYNISTFTTTDIPIETETPEEAHLGRVNTPIQALSSRALAPGNAQAATNAAKPPSTASSSTSASPTPSPVSPHASRVPSDLLQTRRQIHRLRPHHPSCLHLLLPLAVGEPSPSPANSPPSSRLGANLLFARRRAILLIKCPRRHRLRSSPPSASASTSSSPASSAATHRPTRVPTTTRHLPPQLPQHLPHAVPLLLDTTHAEYATNFSISSSPSPDSSSSSLSSNSSAPSSAPHAPDHRRQYLINLIPYILYNVTPFCALSPSSSPSEHSTAPQAHRDEDQRHSASTASSPPPLRHRPHLCRSLRFDDPISPPPTAARKPSSPSSRTARPDLLPPTASGSPARPTAPASPPASSTTALRRRNNKFATSPSSSSTPRFTLQRRIFATSPDGTRRSTPGSSTTAGSAPSPASHRPRRYKPFTVAPSPRSRSSHLLQEGVHPFAGDELQRTLRLHRRPQTIRLRNQAPSASSSTKKSPTRLSPSSWPSCHPFALSMQKGPSRHRHRHRLA